MSIDAILVAVLLAAVVFVVVQVVRKRSTLPRGSGARAEAYFKAMFPELQPHFHPDNAAKFVRARNARDAVADGDAWRSPPGFATASAVIALERGRERVRLRDAQDGALAEFDYRREGNGAQLTIGAGTMRVDLAETGNPRVRYRHPEREFTWSPRDGWRFMTPVAERAIEPDDQGSRFSRDSDRSSSSSSSGATTAALAGGAAAAMVSGAGGAFDGGGASGEWDGGDGGTVDGASADSGGSATAY